jgi:hypothetical protein
LTVVECLRDPVRDITFTTVLDGEYVLLVPGSNKALKERKQGLVLERVDKGWFFAIAARREYSRSHLLMIPGKDKGTRVVQT